MSARGDPWTRFVAGLLFPLHERLKGHSSAKRRRELERSQWWPRAQLDAQRVSRLRSLLTDAHRHVPYYRRVFDEANFDPSTVRAIDDLAKLPFLTKTLIRANTDALKADDAPTLRRYNTGGSSGEPLVFYIGKGRVSHDVAAKWRATRWWGVDIGDTEIVLWGSPIELGAQDRLRSVRDRLLRTKLLPAFDMSLTSLDRFVAEIRARRPRMLFGYPSVLAKVAAHAKAGGQRLDDVGIRVAFVTSEMLYDHQRELIGIAFGCPVANGYGGRDAGFIAHECPRGGMHISAEDVIVEIVGPRGEVLADGEPGEIVVTHLATRHFPFIRYRTGDVGVLAQRTCACGRGLPLLEQIQGRSTDFVIAADGTVMHGLALIYVLRDLPGIASFKIVQESRQRVRVQIVPGPDLLPALEARIRDGFRARLGADVEVNIERVDAIEPERSGKFRYVISHAMP
ncbi:MAG: phenylacetate--CoA ligase family protein [Betaproteobacteria bacterium]